MRAITVRSLILHARRPQQLLEVRLLHVFDDLAPTSFFLMPGVDWPTTPLIHCRVLVSSCIHDSKASSVTDSCRTAGTDSTVLRPLANALFDVLSPSHSSDADKQKKLEIRSTTSRHEKEPYTRDHGTLCLLRTRTCQTPMIRFGGQAVYYSVLNTDGTRST